MGAGMHNRLTACPGCDALYRVIALDPGSVAECPRCGEQLYRKVKFTLDDALALVVGALLLLVLANLFPIMTFELSGRQQSNLLISGPLDLYREGFQGLAVWVFTTSIFLPFCYLIGLLYVLLPIRFHQTPPGVVGILKLIDRLPAWVMLDVYVVGALVGYVKLAAFGSTLPGVSLVALFLSAVAMLGARAALDIDGLWDEISTRSGSDG
jgi:paraquat-inducible protein A